MYDFLVFVSELVSSAFAECDYQKLSAAFLVERQAASEGAHVFKPYVTWFEVSCNMSLKLQLEVKSIVSKVVSAASADQ